MESSHEFRVWHMMMSRTDLLLVNVDFSLLSSELLTCRPLLESNKAFGPHSH